MTTLSTLFGGGGGDSADPLQEGLPVVAIYGGDFNQRWDVRLHRVHSGELVGSPWGAVTGTTASYSHGMTNLHTFGYQNDNGNLASQMSSQAFTSYNDFSQSLYQNDHYPYAMYGNCSGEGRLGTHSFHGADWYQKYYRRINVVSLKGRRPRRQFNLNNQYFSETNFNSYFGQRSVINLDTAYITPAGIASPNYTSYGTACYNQNTKTLAIFYATSTGSDAGRIYMFRGTKDLMSESECPTVKDFFDTTTLNYIQLTSAIATAYSSMSYNANLVLGDNDFVALSSRSGNTDYYKVFDCTSTTNVTSAISQYSETTIGNTTSYSSAQGMQYRARFQMSWDGEWGVCYTPYYYYGGGLSAFVFSIKNPRKMAKIQITESSGGGGLFPSGRSGFKWLHGQNTDSAPINSWGIDLNQTGHDHTETFNYGAGSNNAASGVQSSVANFTGSLNNSKAEYSFQYPGYSYTTSYPRFMSVNWWKQEGNYVT